MDACTLLVIMGHWAQGMEGTAIELSISRNRHSCDHGAHVWKRLETWDSTW